MFPFSYSRVLTCLASALLLQACASVPKPVTTTTERVTSTLRPEPGFTGSRMGAEVEEVFISDDERFQVIDLLLPLDPEVVDEIQVESASGQPVDLRKKPEINPEQDGQATGVRLFLSRDKKWEFRLRLIDNPDE